ncbi:hypothetical protein ACWDLG_10705 [Nonomuraea sp. NPDC003727]
MSLQGIVLYGPPASGKDTVTAALRRLDPRFVLLPKLKVGTRTSRRVRGRCSVPRLWEKPLLRCGWPIGCALTCWCWPTGRSTPMRSCSRSP